MKPTFLWGACAVSIFLAGAAQANGAWERIDVPLGEYQVTVDGADKTVNPGCALGDPYSFHFKDGKHDKLLIYYNGGGACWNSNTCIGSLFTPLPTYFPSAEVANNPEDTGGILDADNPANPYADWSMLFVSYCTGDVHTGSTVTAYEYPPGSGNLVPINHRGFDNFLYAMDWLKTHHPEIAPGKILTAGSSAGSYGAAMNYPWVHEFYPDADKIFLLADGGAGVFTNAYEFENAVLGEPSVWNFYANIHPALASVPDAVLGGVPESFMPEIYVQLRAEYPKQKFAQYTTAYDAIQILFWDVMLNPGDPLLWGQGLSNPFFILGWNAEMNTINSTINLSLPDNYRSYIGPGCNHTILRYDDDFYTSSLISTAGEEIRFLQWLSGMTGGKGADKKDWQNLSCTPFFDCGEANLTVDGINACVARSVEQ